MSRSLNALTRDGVISHVRKMWAISFGGICPACGEAGSGHSDRSVIACVGDVRFRSVAWFEERRPVKARAA